MAGVVARTRFGPETYEVNTGVTGVTGGLLVEPDSTTGKVKLAANESDVWLGVALYDAQPAGTSGEGTSNGFFALNAAVPQPEVAVAWHGVHKLKNSAAGALAFGALVVTAANGEVKAKGAATSRVVGQVVQTTGALAGATVLVRLF
jgi:hypothetical protein